MVNSRSDARSGSGSAARESPEEGASGGGSGNREASPFHGIFDRELAFSDLVPLGVWATRAVDAVLEGHLDDFRQVEGLPVRALGDLLSATEAIGDNEGLRRGIPDGGQEFQFADRYRHVVLVFVEPK